MTIHIKIAAFIRNGISAALTTLPRAAAAPIYERMTHHEFDQALWRLEQRLPGFAARSLRYFVDSSPWVRIPPALAFIAGGFVGFLPILGFWMIPLGLVLLAQDIPALRPPLARMLNWIDRKLPASKQGDAPKA